MKRMIRLVTFICVVAIIPRASAQLLPGSQWESLGPEGGYLTALAQNDATGNLYAVSNGSPARFFRSTNNGDQWQCISQISDYISLFALDAQSPQNIVAVGSDLGAGSNLKVYKSTDAGQSWGQRQFAGQTGTSYFPQHLETDPFDSKKLNLAGYCYSLQGGRAVFAAFECLSTNGGDAWTVSTYANVTSGYFYGLCSATDPADSRTKYLGGYTFVSGSSTGKLYKSTDSGLTWTDISGTSLRGYVYDLHIDRTNPSKLVAVTGAGVYASTDKGTTWPATPRSVYGNRICCDPRSNAVLFVYGSGTTVYRSSDGGTNWELLKGVLSGGSCTSFFPSSSVSGTVYASTRSGCFRSVNGGQTWTAANNGLMCAEVPVLKCVPADPKSMFISFMYSGLYKTSNALAKPSAGGIDWQKMPEYSYCEGILHMELHPTNPDILYIQEGAG